MTRHVGHRRRADRRRRTSELAERDLVLDVARACSPRRSAATTTASTADELRAAAFRQVVLARVHAARDRYPRSSPVARADHSRPAQDRRGDHRATAGRAGVPPQLRRARRGADQQLHLGACSCRGPMPAALSISPARSRNRSRSTVVPAPRSRATSRRRSSWPDPTRRPAGDEAVPAPDGDDCPPARWRAVRLARLGRSLCATMPRAAVPVAACVDWYATTGWEVDAAYRQSELIRVTSGVVLDELDELFHHARQRYERGSTRCCDATADALGEPRCPRSDLQRSIHDAMFGAARQRRPTCWSMPSATSSASTSSTASGASTPSVEIAPPWQPRRRSPRSAWPPFSPVPTPTSRSSSTPRIARGPRRRQPDQIGVKDRVQRLEHAHGTVADLVLDDVAQYSNKELKKKIGGASLVLVRSTEIDADGESDQLAASWGSFDVTLNVLQTAVAKLLHAGIQRVVITADHGFLAVRQLGEDRRIDKPITGTGELHRRAWIGRGGTGIRIDREGPARRLRHRRRPRHHRPARARRLRRAAADCSSSTAGCRPRSSIVPVITVDRRGRPPSPQYQIDLSVAGGRITTGVVAVTVAMTGDLFTRESRVRLQLVQDKAPRRRRGRRRRVRPGDGHHRRHRRRAAGDHACRSRPTSSPVPLPHWKCSTPRPASASACARRRRRRPRIVVDDDLD